MMKRYALFVCELDAANGGWADFRQAYDDRNEAELAGMRWVIEKEDNHFAGLMDWHLVDLTRSIVISRGTCLVEHDAEDSDLDEED